MLSRWRTSAAVAVVGCHSSSTKRWPTRCGAITGESAVSWRVPVGTRSRGRMLRVPSSSASFAITSARTAADAGASPSAFAAGHSTGTALAAPSRHVMHDVEVIT